MPDEGGPCAREIRVTTNDPDHPIETFMCHGSVLVPFRAYPALMDVGHLSRDALPQRRTVEITRGDGGRLDLRLKPALSAGLAAELREIDPGERYELDITIGPPWPNGTLDTAVVLETGVVEYPEAPVRVIGEVDPRIRIEPEELVVPYLEEVRTLELPCRFTWLDGRDHAITEARIDDPGLGVMIPGDADESGLVLRVPPDYRQTAVTRTITVHTDDEAMPVVTIPVTFAKPTAVAGDAPHS